MFQLTEKDKEAMLRQQIIERFKPSERDPFMNKPKQVWRGIHRPPTNTEELMQHLEPYETRKKTEADSMERFRDQDRRYYADRKNEESQRLQTIQ